MAWFGIFKKKKKKKQKQKNAAKRKTLSPYAKFKSEVDNLMAQITTTNIILQKHEQEIDEMGMVLENHIKEFKNLAETIVNRPINQPVQRIKPIERDVLSSNPGDQMKIDKFDLSGFSQQERRILTVFFQNKEMALSYVDMAKCLGKSPNTVKNQMRQINMKADLFDFSMGNDSRKRYRLKEGLKIEKYLNIDRPASNPAIQSSSLGDSAVKID